MFELVVARYQEDLAWLKRVPKAFQKTIYDKNETEHWPGSIPLPNVGRESHTYLTHIVERYDSLSPVTVFCQGRPYDHAFDFRHHLNEMVNRGGLDQDFRWFAHIVDWDDNQGLHLFVPWSKNPERDQLDIAGFHRALFGTEGPDIYTFYLGAQFALKSELILSRPRAWYQHALETSLTFPNAAHCFERSWDRVFGVQGVPTEWQGKTLFLKKIAKLENVIQS